jgi:hypothetical protein
MAANQVNVRRAPRSGVAIPKGSAMKQVDAARGKPWDIAVNSAVHP